MIQPGNSPERLSSQPTHTQSSETSSAITLAPETPIVPKASADEAIKNAIERDKRFTTRLVVLLILFGVTGALGLPALWWSKQFSRGEKWFWTVVVSAYTFALIAGTLAICWWALSQIFPNGLPEFR